MERGCKINVSDYLSRIGFRVSDPAPGVDLLKSLQRSHLLLVPFENLDIHWRRPIVLDIEKFYTKIVVEKRGGFCYELNGLFNELLRNLGFQTRLISARVSNGTEHGPEFDHAAIIATIGSDEFLVDVGFGAFAAEPLRLVSSEKQQDANGTFIIRKFDHEYHEVAKLDGSDWRSEYIFKDVERELSDFEEMCNFQQHSPESHFTKGKLCSLLTETGRKTLTDNNFIITDHQGKKETRVNSVAEFNHLLAAEFGIAAINA
jgi:N-hydroxyarylamine O-acetyltransferase